MEELFRIETLQATVRWLGLSQGPTTIGYAPTSPVAVIPARIGEVSYAGGVPPRLFEQSDYRVVVRSRVPGGSVALRHRDPDLLKGVLPADDAEPGLVVGTLNFRNQVGRSRFDVLVDDAHAFSFEVEVYPAKLDYREDYEQILAEVQHLLTALAFDFLKATHVGARERQGSPTALEWVLRLRSVVDELERGLRQVARQPVRSLLREVRTVRAERVRRPDAVLLRAARVGGGAGQLLPLDDALSVRAQLPTQPAQPTLDTLEHRWLADHLRRIRRRLGQLIAAEATRADASNRQKAALEELQAMEGRLDVMLGLEPLRAATGAARAGFTSLQLFGAPGYREAARAIIALQLGLQLEGNALELSLKDISVLYEYWCFLAVLDLVSSRTGRAIDPMALVEARETGLRVMLKKGQKSAVTFALDDARRVRVEYNPRYDSHVLLAQQPDIVIALEEAGKPTVRVVLDAKYRVDATPENQARLGVIGPPADALNVLHRYRDAILTEEPSPDEGQRVARSVVYAAALFPAVMTPSEFTPSRLARQLRTVGVGAIPFLPSNRDILAGWLGELLLLDGWSLGHGAPSSGLDPWVWRAASEVVVVGTLRSAGRAPADEHLTWCLKQKVYYLPERDTRHGRQLGTRLVALYVPSVLGEDGVGAVTWMGRVIESSVVSRGSIATPWLPQNPSELVRVYRVEDWVRLERAIRNTDGHRVSVPRWSSRLALHRASRLAELALESPLEWALTDALRAEGIAYDVRAGEVTALDQMAGIGRARVMVDDARVTYAGANGFECISPDGRSVTVPTVPRVLAWLQREPLGR